MLPESFKALNLMPIIQALSALLVSSDWAGGQPNRKKKTPTEIDAEITQILML